MSRKFIYLNGSKSVEVEYEGKEVINLFIDGKLHDFKEDERPNPNKFAYAEEVKRTKYTQFLNNQFENLVLLSGAGTSIGFGNEERKGKSMVDLWDAAVDEVGELDFCKLLKAIKYHDSLVDIDCEERFKDGAVDRLVLKGEKCTFNRNLESVLSMARPAIPYLNKEEIDVEKCVESIKKMIKKSCSLTLPEEAPHLQLLNKLTKRKVTLPRFKLFTLNYDLMFEQAASRGNFAVIDGFSFTSPRVFSGRNFDYDIVNRHKARVKEEDNFIQKVFHLYKPHGSLNWISKNGRIEQKENPENPLMIYPNSDKFESSYDQPYFEMMSRFQNSLREDNVLLITIGFSFGDKHIVTAIKEAVEQNPSFQLVIVTRSINKTNKNMEPFIEAAKTYSNIHIIAEEFADFVKNYPDLKSYNQEDSKRVDIKLQN